MAPRRTRQSGPKWPLRGEIGTRWSNISPPVNRRRRAGRFGSFNTETRVFVAAALRPLLFLAAKNNAIYRIVRRRDTFRILRRVFFSSVHLAFTVGIWHKQGPAINRIFRFNVVRNERDVYKRSIDRLFADSLSFFSFFFLLNRKNLCPSLYRLFVFGTQRGMELAE